MFTERECKARKNVSMENYIQVMFVMNFPERLHKVKCCFDAP